MNRLAKLAPLALLALAAFDAAPASANPTVRDHRTEEVRDHRTETGPSYDSPPPRRYRRRVGPRFMMPLKIDLGAQGANTKAGFLGGIEGRIGIHWASLSPKPTNFDIGLGLFGAVLGGPKNETMTTSDDSVAYGGAYLEIGQTLSHGSHWRTWASGRGEYMGSSSFGEEQTGFGVAARLSAELYASGVGIEPRGFFLGTYAVGVYVEAGARGLGDDVDALQISGGLTFRTPLVFTP
jgi:hypothetical protein